MTAANLTETVSGYDALARLTSKVTATGSVASYAWTYNRASVITSETANVDGDPTNGETTFSYDPPGRLTSFTRDSTTAHELLDAAEREALARRAEEHRPRGPTDRNDSLQRRTSGAVIEAISRSAPRARPSAGDPTI